MIEKIDISSIVDSWTREVAQKVNEIIDGINDRNSKTIKAQEFETCLYCTGDKTIITGSQYNPTNCPCCHGAGKVPAGSLNYGFFSFERPECGPVKHDKIFNNLDTKKTSKRKIINYLQKALSSINDPKKKSESQDLVEMAITEVEYMFREENKIETIENDCPYKVAKAHLEVGFNICSEYICGPCGYCGYNKKFCNYKGIPPKNCSTCSDYPNGCKGEDFECNKNNGYQDWRA
jgi:hypothetical protein